MAFIRRRLSGRQEGSYSYQILETFRADGKIRQRVLYNLGPSPTIDVALEVQHRPREHRVPEKRCSVKPEPVQL
jgi:hypothetical protein